MSNNKPKDPNNLESYLLYTHAPLIHRAVSSLKAKGHIPDDMEDWEFNEAGIRGLMEAVRDYNPEVAKRVNPASKNPFADFAHTRIRGRIQDHAQSMHAIPKHMRQQAKRFEQFSAQTAQETPAAELASPTAEAARVPKPVKD